MNAIISGDKGYNREEGESYGQYGFTTQEFDTESEELVDIEEETEEENTEEEEEADEEPEELPED